MDLTYDRDIERLLEASAKLKAEAEAKAEAAEELIAKRYGSLGANFAAAIGINRTNFPKKLEDQKALVKEVVAPWLETHPDGWVPQPKRRRRQRTQTVSEEQVEETVEIEEENKSAASDVVEDTEEDVDFSEDDDASSSDNLFGQDPFERAWP